MKNLIIACSVFLASVAMASSFTLSVEDFQADSIFDYVYVTQAEKVFSDDLEMVDLYKVTYEVEGDCAGSGNVDACAMVAYCEYFWVDTLLGADAKPFIEGTEKSCDVHIEDILNPILIDEL